MRAHRAYVTVECSGDQRGFRSYHRKRSSWFERALERDKCWERLKDADGRLRSVESIARPRAPVQPRQSIWMIVTHSMRGVTFDARRILERQSLPPIDNPYPLLYIHHTVVSVSGTEFGIGSMGADSDMIEQTNLEAGAFTMHRVRWLAASSQGEHDHREARINIVLDGIMLERRPHERREYGRGTIFIRPAGLPHSNDYGPSGGLYLTLVMLNEHVQRAARTRSVDEGAATTLLSLATMLEHELRTSDALSKLTAEALGYELCAALSDRDDGRERAVPRWVRTVVDLLHDEMSRTWTLAEIAAVVGVSPTRLSVIFRRSTGTTVGQVLRIARVERVRRALPTTDATLAMLAADVGFADQSHLTRSFRRVLGVTPARFRAARRTGAPRVFATDPF